MGIYNDGKIYGINITTDETGEIVFEKIYDTKMTTEQVKDFEINYQKITTEQKINMRYSIYTCCSCSYDINDYSTFMSWFPVSKDFIDNFILNGDAVAPM